MSNYLDSNGLATLWAKIKTTFATSKVLAEQYAKKTDIATVNGSSLIGGGDVQVVAIDKDTLTIDANITAESTNPVQSAAVHKALDGGFYVS